MGLTREFVLSTVSDALLPRLKPLLEDVVLELLGDRQVPTRTEFQELRDLANNLRGQVSGSTAATTRLRGQVEALEAALREERAAREALARRLEALERGQS